MQGLTRKARSVLRRERRKKQVGELNLVPMIDILVVLVFFLLVNSTGVSILGIDLPDANKPTDPDVSLPLTVLVRGDGLLLSEGSHELGRYGSAAEGYDFRGLSEKLLEVKNARPSEKRITLLIAPTVSHDTLVQTMDAVRITPVDGGRSLRELFPSIALGDAPPAAAAVSTETPP
jgi:biopolymer transport protein ExbD